MALLSLKGLSSMRNSKKRLALFASGRGSNGEALYKAMQEGYINGEFVVIITDHGNAGIVERSKSWNIPLIVMERSDYDSKASFEQAQLDALEPYKIDGIVLAGYMRIVGAPLIERYEHRILNIHPALLPSFPGLHGHQQAIDGGVKLRAVRYTLLMWEWIRGLSLCRIRFLYYPMIQRIL